MFDHKQQTELLQLARQSITSRFNKEPVIYPEDEAYKVRKGVFVTLTKQGELRGCIGYIKGYKDLVPSIVEMAQSAAFQDPRFPSVKESELTELRIEISVLSEMELVKDVNEILIGRDGLLLEHPYGSGLLLPQVPVEWNWDLNTFMEHICYKAGVKPGSWKDEQAKLFSFSAEIFHEEE